MKTKNVLKSMFLLTLATFVFTTAWADGDKNEIKTVTQDGIEIQYTQDVAESNSNHLSDPGIDNLTNYPDPFTSSTTIQYNLTIPGYVNLTISTVGWKIEVLAREYQKAGSHSVVFDATNLPPGVYMCVLEFNNQVVQELMVKKSPFQEKKYLED